MARRIHEGIQEVEGEHLPLEGGASRSKMCRVHDFRMVPQGVEKEKSHTPESTS